MPYRLCSVFDPRRSWTSRSTRVGHKCRIGSAVFSTTYYGKRYERITGKSQMPYRLCSVFDLPTVFVDGSELMSHKCRIGSAVFST